VPGSYLDILLVGGGGGGAGNNHNDPAYWGNPGEIRYIRVGIDVASTQITPIRIGSGGTAGYYHDYYAYGGSGTPSYLTLFGTTYTAAGGGGGAPWSLYYPYADATLVKDGLFSDNTTFYVGGTGGRNYGNQERGANWGGPGGSGSGSYPYGSHDAGTAGLSGTIVIRYPIIPPT
jgi:hypothetical protein